MGSLLGERRMVMPAARPRPSTGRERARLRLGFALSQRVAMAAHQGQRSFEAQVRHMLEDWLRQHGPCGAQPAAPQGEG
jgi:hypothetical protein